ncbi:unnamed protein product [Macrosiphum euphorbiae]|uniref:Uncharacterized protein n=1 Tax=Macrosiphum euphorbiae TaxID=13131 RepID=A0AAV0W2M1_9HEMI|nr:unnamed protein product [Macrosiphum euphorbiae]
MTGPEHAFRGRHSARPPAERSWPVGEARHKSPASPPPLYRSTTVIVSTSQSSERRCSLLQCVVPRSHSLSVRYPTQPSHSGSSRSSQRRTCVQLIFRSHDPNSRRVRFDKRLRNEKNNKTVNSSKPVVRLQGI